MVSSSLIAKDHCVLTNPATLTNPNPTSFGHSLIPYRHSNIRVCMVVIPDEDRWRQNHIFLDMNAVSCGNVRTSGDEAMVPNSERRVGSFKLWELRMKPDILMNGDEVPNLDQRRSLQITGVVNGNLVP
jgi:hypothetical protein